MATTQHDREQDLLEAAAKYRVLVEHLPAIVYSAREGRPYVILSLRESNLAAFTIEGGRIAELALQPD